MSLEQIYNPLPIGVCVLRDDRAAMDICYLNAAMLRFLGQENPEPLLGQHFEHIWPHKDAAKMMQQLRSPGSAVSSFVLPVDETAGTHWIKFDISRAEWQGAPSIILWATDISANKAAEERLKSEVEKADAMAEMKTNFLATMSHEIRTPMQTIYGFLELMASENPDAKIAGMIATAQNAASGLLEILDDILDLAKMDADKMDLDMFEVPVRTLVSGVLEALSVKVQNKRVQLIGDVGQNVPFVIIGDPKRLRQILMNLVGNSLKFTSQGHVMIQVSTQTQVLKNNSGKVALRFEISDTGIGIKPDVCAKLFQPFTQADSSTSRKFGGTGLGLSICRKLVDLMGGQIGVTSTEGKGSTFWFEIPTEEVSTDSVSAELPNLEGLSLLSVEDHPQGSKEIVRSLSSMGAKVESCGTCAETLDLIKRRPFDVAIIDQGLPDGLGLNLIREIMNLRPFMGLIMYTVREDAGLAYSLQALGVPYITKPASRAGLGDAIRKAAARASVKTAMEGPVRLLIAEDTGSVRDILKRQLDKIGIEADFAQDGREAIEALETGQYGILITDLHMPHTDGYQLVEHIRRDEKPGPHRFPVILMTADVQMAQRDAYSVFGFDECLLKPVSLGQLRRLLMRWGVVTEQSAAAVVVDSPAVFPSPQGSAIDKAAIVAQMGALDADAVGMIRMFIDMTAPLLEKMQDAGARNDLAALQEIGHSLKGAARSACCMTLGDLADGLQDQATRALPWETIIQNILKEFERVKSEIGRLL